MLSTILTIGILLFLIGYIMIKGIPNIKPELFQWEYNTLNVSLMPALINTVIMTLISLLIAAPIGVFSAIYWLNMQKKATSWLA